MTYERYKKAMAKLGYLIGEQEMTIEDAVALLAEATATNIKLLERHVNSPVLVPMKDRTGEEEEEKTESDVEKTILLHGG